MTFYKGLPLLAKIPPQLSLLVQLCMKIHCCFCEGLNFLDNLFHQRHIGASYLIGHCICYATYINFQVSLYHFISLVSHDRGGESVDGLCTEACNIVENVSCSIINLNHICKCFWCSSNGHCGGLSCGQLMQLGPCIGYKSGHHSLQCMLF
ncbi:unnamed protein product [Sphagnum balticum]